MNGRMYDPVLGRMLSADNYIADNTSTQAYNRYTYANNNPMKFVDPDGELAWFVPVIVGAAVGGITGGAISAKNGESFWKGFGIGVGIGASIGLVASYGMSFINPSSKWSTNHALYNWKLNHAHLSKSSLNNSFDYVFSKGMNGIPVDRSTTWVSLPPEKSFLNSPKFTNDMSNTTMNFTTDDINLNDNAFRELETFTGRVRFELNRFTNNDVSADIRRFPFNNNNISFEFEQRRLISDPIKLRVLNNKNIFKGFLSSNVFVNNTNVLLNNNNNTIADLPTSVTAINRIFRVQYEIIKKGKPKRRR